MKKDSNIYTFLYASVLVVIVGITLSAVYQALNPLQQKNIADDTKRQILAAALIVPKQGENIADLYSQHVKTSYIVDSKGNKIDSKESAFDVNVSQEMKVPADKRLLPVFECTTDAGLKYIFPVYGAGLWGPIWGYIAFNDNGTTIYGAYFAHAGETPGLGAEIEKPAFSDQFEGKDIFNANGEFEGVKVVKSGKEPASGAYVHAISGGTITSTGVQKMLETSLEPYTEFLKQIGEKTASDTNNTKE